MIYFTQHMRKYSSQLLATFSAAINVTNISDNDHYLFFHYQEKVFIIKYT